MGSVVIPIIRGDAAGLLVDPNACPPEVHGRIGGHRPLLQVHGGLLLQEYATTGIRAKLALMVKNASSITRNLLSLRARPRLQLLVLIGDPLVPLVRRKRLESPRQRLDRIARTQMKERPMRIIEP